MPRALVLCGGAETRSRAGEQIVRLTLDDNVKLRLESIGGRMVADLDDILTDLLEVATYVFCADQMVSRGGKANRKLGADWRRSFRFRIPVRRVERWLDDDIRESLEALLGFLSDDDYEFEFIPATAPVGPGKYLKFSNDDAFKGDCVSLFSGGLDSLAGAVEALSEDARLTLVSHQSASKVAHKQTDLFRELQRRFPKKVLHIPVLITKQATRTIETTQRTRSFLFGALAAIVAHMSRLPPIRFYENGVVSLNLPISGEVVGARASRTTHPRTIAGLSDFLSMLLKGEIRIETPFLWRTKSEVLTGLGQSSCRDLIPFAISCSHVHGTTALHNHCGECSQCLERRFSALAAGLGQLDSADMYAVDLLTGSRENGTSRALAEGYVRHARELSRMSNEDFARQFSGQLARIAGCLSNVSAEAVAINAAEMHRRHGTAVMSVVAEGIRVHAKQLADGDLPRSCVLRMVAANDTVPAQLASPADRSTGQTATEDRNFETTLEIRLAIETGTQTVLIEGIPPIGRSAVFDLLAALVSQYEVDRSAGRSPERYRYVKTRQLEGALKVSGQTLRRRVLDFRKSVADEFIAHAGLPISHDALIQSTRWQGYRINPSVRVLAPDQVRRVA